MIALKYKLVLPWALLVPPAILFGQATPASDKVFKYVNGLMSNIRNQYFIFETGDSGFNHGIPSGLFGSPTSLLTSDAINAGCVFDPQASDGCSSSTAVYDTKKAMLRLKIPPLTNRSQYFGLNLEEPEKYGITRVGVGVDLSGTNSVTFEVAGTSAACQVKFAVRGSETPFMSLPALPTTVMLPFDSLNPPLRRLTMVHVLFTIATDAAHCSAGGSVLVRNVQLLPSPTPTQNSALGFPLADETFGVKPLQVPCASLSSQPAIPPDQVNRNLAPIYESSLVLMGLLNRGDPILRPYAGQIADAFVYALNHPNSALLLPPRPDRGPVQPASDPMGPAILNNAYRSGQLPLDDDQPLGQGQVVAAKRGEVGLAGFSAALGNFCLVLDGATGGNNAFAILSLVAASRQFESDADGPYLVTARRIARWIDENLRSDTGLLGFYIGWNDGGDRSSTSFLYGKSVENNADIYAAMTVLGDREIETGDKYGYASRWKTLAIWAGDFVMRMKVVEDNGAIHFYSGTVPCTQSADWGIIPSANCQTADPTILPDVFNKFDFIDATTFVTLSLAGSQDYGSAIDWSLPVQWSKSHQGVSITSYGRTVQGFDLVQPNHVDPVPDGIPELRSQRAFPTGVAWEFTGQMVVTMKVIDSLYPSQAPFLSDETTYTQEIWDTQIYDHFTNGLGLVAATLDDSNMPGPYYSCLATPYQCIASRTGLAATMWATFAETGFNPLGRPQPGH
jgi:hypothetical protein